MENLFKEDSMGIDVSFSSFESAVEGDSPIEMLRFYTVLKKNGCLDYKRKDFKKLIKKIGRSYYENDYVMLKGALTIFHEISKTKKFRDRLAKEYKKSLTYHNKIKNMKAEDLECGWVDEKGKPAFTPEENMENHITRTLQEMYAAKEFLGDDIC